MKPAPFVRHAPTTLEGAIEVLQRHGDEARVLAGGQSLVPMLALRLARFEHLVDLEGIAELRGVVPDGDWLRIGAMERQAVLERDARITELAPLLAAAAPFVGHFQIRNRGTVGGSVAHADPAAELPAVLLALDGRIEVAGRAGRRRIPAAELAVGPWTTSLAPDEVLVAVEVPAAGAGHGAALHEVARRHGDFALAGVACALDVDAQSMLTRIALVAFGVAATPLLASWAEPPLVGRQAAGLDPHDVGAAVRDGLPELTDDIHADPVYRREAVTVLAARAFADARRDALTALASDRHPNDRGPRPASSREPQPRPESRPSSQRLAPERDSQLPGSQPEGQAPAPGRRLIELAVDGRRHEVLVEDRTTLVDALREGCGLTGTHAGCEHGACGACTVLLDGDAVRSCLTFAVQTAGQAITTVAGLAGEGGGLGPVQAALRQHHGLQCGFCTPGVVVSLAAWVRDHEVATDDEIRAALSGTYCRCTGYQGMVAAARELVGAPAGKDRPAVSGADATVGAAVAPVGKDRPAVSGVDGEGDVGV